MHVPFLPRPSWILGLLLLAFPLLGGCAKNEAPAQANAPADQATPSPMLAATATQGTPALPAGHPSMPAQGGAHPAMPGMPAHEVNQELAARHPQPGGAKKIEVVVPDAVKGQWSTVYIGVTPAGGQEKVEKVAIGGKLSLGGGRELQVLHYLPAYTSDFQTATSSSNEPVNPAIQVRLVEKGQASSEGWVFQNLPDFNSFKNASLAVKLISADKR